MTRFFSRFSNLTLVLLVAITLSGCIKINLGNGNAQQLPTPARDPELPPLATIQPPQHVLSEVRLLNAEYLSPLLQVPVKLVDGKFAGIASGTELNVSIRPGIVYGDLNSDGVEDAAFILAEDTGGSGVFTSLVVIYSESGQYAQAPGVMIDDRPVINNLVIDSGVVKLDALVHGPNDPMVNPTTSIRAEYSLWGGLLVQTRLSSAFAGSGEHVIYVDSPTDGGMVSGSVNVKGSMPIGPFENNLALQVIDITTGQLLRLGAFMVVADDMGAPATFDNLVTLPDVPAGTRLLLVLSELSMADGTPMAVDSVWLVVE